MVMPLSIYQILFTGYWFWANFIPPKLFPTLNAEQTLLARVGLILAVQAARRRGASWELPRRAIP